MRKVGKNIGDILNFPDRVLTPGGLESLLGLKLPSNLGTQIYLCVQSHPLTPSNRIRHGLQESCARKSFANHQASYRHVEVWS